MKYLEQYRTELTLAHGTITLNCETLEATKQLVTAMVPNNLFISHGDGFLINDESGNALGWTGRLSVPEAFGVRNLIESRTEVAA